MDDWIEIKDSLISLRGSGSTPASPHDRRFLGQEQLAPTGPPVQLRAALWTLSRLPKVDPIVHLVQHFLDQRVRHLKVEQVLKAITIEQLYPSYHFVERQLEGWLLRQCGLLDAHLEIRSDLVSESVRGEAHERRHLHYVQTQPQPQSFFHSPQSFHFLHQSQGQKIGSHPHLC